MSIARNSSRRKTRKLRDLLFLADSVDTIALFDCRRFDDFGPQSSKLQPSASAFAHFYSAAVPPLYTPAAILIEQPKSPHHTNDFSSFNEPRMQTSQSTAELIDAILAAASLASGTSATATAVAAASFLLAYDGAATSSSSSSSDAAEATAAAGSAADSFGLQSVPEPVQMPSALVGFYDASSVAAANLLNQNGLHVVATAAVDFYACRRRCGPAVSRRRLVCATACGCERRVRAADEHRRRRHRMAAAAARNRDALASARAAAIDERCPRVAVAAERRRAAAAAAAAAAAVATLRVLQRAHRRARAAQRQRRLLPRGVFALRAVRRCARRAADVFLAQRFRLL